MVVAGRPAGSDHMLKWCSSRWRRASTAGCLTHLNASLTATDGVYTVTANVSLPPRYATSPPMGGLRLEAAGASRLRKQATGGDGCWKMLAGVRRQSGQGRHLGGCADYRPALCAAQRPCYIRLPRCARRGVYSTEPCGCRGNYFSSSDALAPPRLWTDQRINSRPAIAPYTARARPPPTAPPPCRPPGRSRSPPAAL